MGSLAVLIVVIVVVAGAIAGLKAKSTGSKDADGPWPYYARKPLSQVEQVLYFRLCKALPQHIVLAQVGLSRVLGVKKSSNYQSWDNRISRMSADFVVCAKDATVLVVIELDDASHEKDRRKIADAKKEKALASAGIRLIRWQARSLPNEQEVQGAVQGKSATGADRRQEELAN